jgi:hypothetical protein
MPGVFQSRLELWGFGVPLAHAVRAKAQASRVKGLAWGTMLKSVDGSF